MLRLWKHCKKLSRRDVTKTERLVLGLQPAGAALPQLVPEYNYFLHVLVPFQSNPVELEPAPAVLLSRRVVTWEMWQAESRDPKTGVKVKLDTSLLAPNSQIEVLRFGFPVEPDAFVKRAVQVGHPYDFESNLDQMLKDVVEENIVGDPVNLCKTRLKTIARWKARAKELEADEKALHESLPEHIKKTVEGKRLLLWREIIRECKLPDQCLIDDLLGGFKLSGWLPESKSFPGKVRCPEFSVDTLKALAPGLNKATLGKMMMRQHKEVEQATWDETVEEAKQGWIWEAPDFDPSRHVLVRRFGLLQKDKTRPIDDCSACGLNSTTGLLERVVLHSVDCMAALLAHAVKLQQRSGTTCHLEGRTYDLKSAYKQFPLSAADRDMLRLLVNEPGCATPRAFGFNSLPFGAVGSVAAFLRLSASIWQIGVIALRLMWTAFYDDFSVVSKRDLKRNAAYAVQSLFELLGLTYATEGKKAPPFGPEFGMLGLVVDLCRFDKGIVRFGHTQRRIAELHAFLDEIQCQDCLDPKTAERLRGRMNFFEGHCFGRGPAQALRVLDSQARNGALAKSLTAQALAAIRTLKNRLDSHRPIEISGKVLSTFLLFTDGAFESGSGSVGGVLYNCKGMPLGFFGERAPRRVMDLLSGSANPIYELELLPILQAIKLWSRTIANAQLVVYLDNDAARHALIKAYAATTVAASIVTEVSRLENLLQVKVWYARVNTKSNPADAPSRMCFDAFDSNLRCHSLSWDVSATAKED